MPCGPPQLGIEDRETELHAILAGAQTHGGLGSGPRAPDDERPARSLGVVK